MRYGCTSTVPTPETGGMDWGDLPSWFALVLSIGSLLWQWRTESKTSSKEKATVKLARIESFERSLAEVRLLATTYWMTPEVQSAKEGIMLLHHLREMAVDAKRYKSVFWASVEADTLRLKMQTTGASFQQVDRPVYPASDAFMKQFMATIAGMSSQVKAAKDRIIEC